MSVFGIDYAWGRPGVAALKKAGAVFVARYFSHDVTGKNLTAGEARQLSDAGIWITGVWESAASRPLAGRAAGVADAKAAAEQAKTCGMPAGRPIYFAADWDATAGQQDEIHAYLDGAASVLGRDRVGLYAGYGPIKRAFDAKKIAFGWQTYAWSGGKWDPRAQLQQYSNDHYINGVGCDYDRGEGDFGQWRLGAVPTPAPKPKPPTAPPWPGRVLEQPPTMTGDDVLAWQRQMVHRGWQIAADGQYGPASQRVCRAFQAMVHITVDGKVGPQTWALTWTAPVT